MKAQPLLEQVAASLDIPAGAEVVGGIVFRPLDELMDRGVPEPKILVDDILYAEGVHIVDGHPGHGKTSWVMYLCLIAMAQGTHIAWLDFEGGLNPTVRRLIEVGVPSRLVKEFFHYADWPKDAEKYLTDIAARWPGALVVVDSFSKALSSAGVNENANDEVTKWTVQVVQACKQRALPIVLIDHVAKTGDSNYSRGAGSKHADTDVHWRVLRTQEFNRKQVGSISVSQKKDRPGYFPFGSWWRVGDGNGGLTFEPMDSPPGEDDPNAPAI